MADNNIMKCLKDTPLIYKIVGGALLAGGVVYIRHRMSRTKTPIEYPRDTVILHQLGRGPFVPSFSPFVIKLETFCRMAGVRYQNVQDVSQPSKKGKIPWIEYNGEQIADSDFSIQFLIKTLKLNVNSHLRPEEEGIGRAFQRMLEENTYWTHLLNSVILDEENKLYKYFNVPWYLIPLIKRSLRKSAYGHGIGRHTKEEIEHIMRVDMEAVSRFLGDKDFLLGDEPCQYDCAVFGMLAVIRWASFGGQGGHIIKDYTNLCSYCDRMKDRFWPDWDQSIQRNVGTKEDIYIGKQVGNF